MSYNIGDLRKENDELRELLERAANGLRWYQVRYPEDTEEEDEIMFRINVALLKGTE